MRTICLSVGGAPLNTDATFTRHNPLIRVAATSAVAAPCEDACAAGDAALAAFADWSATPRLAMLNRAAAHQEG